MPEVKDIGADATKEAKIALALEILGIVFAFIPFVDEVTPEFLPIVEGTFDFLTIGGNVGLEVQSIISNPTSAPMDILGALIGAGVRDEEDFVRFSQLKFFKRAVAGNREDSALPGWVCIATRRVPCLPKIQY